MLTDGAGEGEGEWPWLWLWRVKVIAIEFLELARDVERAFWAAAALPGREAC